MPAAAGFWSYAREDDARDGGRIRRLADAVKNEYSLQTGEEIELFVDRDVKWGEAWRHRIDSALSITTFFIPVVTPRYFQRDECRHELQTFAGHAKSLGQEQLLMPVYYVAVPGLGDGTTSKDEAVQLVGSMQWVDWRELRLEDEQSAEHRQNVHSLAARLVEISQSVARSEERAQGDSRNATTHDDEPGVVELVATAEEAMPRFTHVMDTLWPEIEHITEIVNEWRPRIERAGSKGAGPTLVAVQQFAQALDEPSERIERLGAEYATELVKIDPAVLSLIRLAEMGQWNGDTAREMFSGINELQSVTQNAARELDELFKALDQAAMLSKDLRRPLRRMRTGLQKVLDGHAVVAEWDRRARKVAAEWTDSEPSALTD